MFEANITVDAKSSAKPLLNFDIVFAVAGATNILIAGPSGYNHSSNGRAKPGDLFTIESSDSNHKKVYQVTRVEASDIYLAGAAVDNDQLRVHLSLIHI